MDWHVYSWPWPNVLTLMVSSGHNSTANILKTITDTTNTTSAIKRTYYVSFHFTYFHLTLIHCEGHVYAHFEGENLWKCGRENSHKRYRCQQRMCCTNFPLKFLHLTIAFSRLDYCNAVLYGVSDHNISRLQRIQNNLTRVVCSIPYRSSVTGLIRSLHWLSIRERIPYNISLMTNKVRFLKKSAYLDELITNYEPTRSLRSSDKVLLA